MDELLTQKLTLIGWLTLAGYEAFALASVIGALTLGEDGVETAKRDRLYQLSGLATPFVLALVLLAALIGLFVLTRGPQLDPRVKLLVTAAKVTAGAAVLLAIALAIALATDDRLDNRWAQMVGALASLPVSAAVLLLPLGTGNRSPSQVSTSPTSGPTTVQNVSPPPPPAPPAPPTR